MAHRWMTILMVLLALALLAGTGCVKKQSPKTTVGFGETGFGETDPLIIGYDEFGNAIYADGTDSMVRTDGSEISAGQFDAVYFEFDSPQLNPSEQGKIDAIVSYLHQNPTLGVIVEGHCDERGSNEYNLALGERRALAVRASMISRGVDGARVQTRSYGEERPVAFGHDEASWRLNRRAEFVLTQM